MENLTCTLCSELYSDPRMLPCLHSFCYKCVMKLVEDLVATDSTLKCPTCGATNQLLSGECKQLHRNLWLAHEVEVASFQQKIERENGLPCDKCAKSSTSFCCTCCLLLCASCLKDHQSWKELASHELIDLEQATGSKFSFPRNSKPCPLHSKQLPAEPLKFYCKTCECLICRDCMAITHKDCQHDYIDSAARKECNDLHSCLRETEKALAELNAAIDRGEKTTQLINSQKSKVMEEIERAFDELQTAVKERRKALHDQCEKVAASKIAALAGHMEHLKSLSQKIASAKEMAANALQTHTPSELLSTKKLIKEELVRSHSLFEQMFLDTVENETIATGQLKNDSVIQSISKVGDILSPLDSSTLAEKGINIPHACVGKEMRMAIVVNLKPSICNRTPLIQAYDSTTGMKVNVSKVKNGRIFLSFVPQQTGLRLVHVKTGREKSSCGPFPIWVQQRRDYTTLSVQQTIIVGDTTRGIAVHPNGDIFANSFSNHCVKVFKKDGFPRSRIGSSGYGNGQLSNPWGLTLVGDILYVVENGNNRIHKFTITGQYVGKFGSSGSADGQFSNPLGICADNMGHILVADQCNQRVQAFNAHDDSFAYSIPCSNSPYDIAVDNAGNIHVALYANDHIQVFSPDGKLGLEAYNGSGKVKHPVGIAISPDGHKFIVDYSNKCLHVLDQSNTQVACYSGLSGPYAVTIGAQGHIYVADSSSSCILKY